MMQGRRWWRKQQGNSISIVSGNANVTFDVIKPDKNVDGFGEPKVGGEATAILVKYQNNLHVLKEFNTVPNSARIKQIKKLTKNNFVKKSDLFSGIPKLFIQGQLDGKNFTGHITEHVKGCDLKTWIARENFNPTYDVRKLLAIQVLTQVMFLEKQGLTHGDLSSGNVMIDYNDVNPALSTAKLIDYDFSIDKKNGLVLPDVSPGSDGYIHPEIIRIANDPNALSQQKNDLFALAVILVEIMTTNQNTFNVLNKSHKRATLLDTQALENKQYSIPPCIEKLWPAGCQLLEKAVISPLDKQPTVQEWLKAIGHCGLVSSADLPVSIIPKSTWANCPILVIKKGAGNQYKKKVQSLRLKKEGETVTNFGVCDPSLDDLTLSYSKKGTQYSIRVSNDQRVFFLNKKKIPIGTEIHLQHGDVLSYRGQWEIELTA